MTTPRIDHPGTPTEIAEWRLNLDLRDPASTLSADEAIVVVHVYRKSRYRWSLSAHVTRTQTEWEWVAHRVSEWGVGASDATGSLERVTRTVIDDTKTEAFPDRAAAHQAAEAFVAALIAPKAWALDSSPTTGPAKP